MEYGILYPHAYPVTDMCEAGSKRGQVALTGKAEERLNMLRKCPKDGKVIW